MAPLSLLHLLSNEYLLLATTPYLLPTELLALALCSRSFYSLINHSRSVWRHLNLSVSPRALPASSSTAIAQRTQTPLYQTELTQLLTKPFVLRDVKTLILDGLPVTVELLHDLLSSPRYKIQLLSIRECSLINERQLMLLFQYLVRTTRENPPALKGCYWFGGMDALGGIFPSAFKQRDPSSKGRFIKPGKLSDDWVGILKACEGAIAFDTRLCSGPRHEEGDEHHVDPKVASIRLTGNCTGCGSSPEARRPHGFRSLPKVVVAPVPVTSSDIRVACQAPDVKDILRCETCVKNRWCERCGKWWCESCADENAEKKFVSLDCYDCGMMCGDCTRNTSRTCKSCRGEYCVVHNEGADNNWCEWCNSPERRLRELIISQPDQYTMQQRARTLARLNAIRNSFGVGGRSRFQDEVIVRNRCLVSL